MCRDREGASDGGLRLDVRDAVPVPVRAELPRAEARHDVEQIVNLRILVGDGGFDARVVPGSIAKPVGHGEEAVAEAESKDESGGAGGEDLRDSRRAVISHDVEIAGRGQNERAESTNQWQNSK